MTSLVGEEEGDDDGMPVGLITIDYDMTSDPSHLTFSFSDSFSFGDDGDSPFVPGTKAEVFQHSTGENYLLFTSSSFFGAAEDNNGDGDYDDDGDDSGMAVQVCLDSDDDIDMINSGDVAASDYLSTASKSYFQLIWQDSTVADAMPSKWHARAYMTQGGVYIAGPVSFDAGAGGTATTISPISIKVPRCSAVTAEQMTTWKGTMNTYFSKDAISLSGDSNEFAHLNLDLSATSDAARFLTTAEAEAAFPTFSYLKLVDDPTAASIDPVVAQ